MEFSVCLFIYLLTCSRNCTMLQVCGHVCVRAL